MFDGRYTCVLIRIEIRIRHIQKISEIVESSSSFKILLSYSDSKESNIVSIFYPYFVLSFFSPPFLFETP